MNTKRTLGYVGLFALAFAAVVSASCRSRSGDPGMTGGTIDAGALDKAALLRSIGDCVFGEYRTFATKAGELEAATAQASADKAPA